MDTTWTHRPLQDLAKNMTSSFPENRYGLSPGGFGPGHFGHKSDMGPIEDWWGARPYRRWSQQWTQFGHTDHYKIWQRTWRHLFQKTGTDLGPWTLDLDILDTSQIWVLLRTDGVPDLIGGGRSSGHSLDTQTITRSGKEQDIFDTNHGQRSWILAEMNLSKMVKKWTMLPDLGKVA